MKHLFVGILLFVAFSALSQDNPVPTTDLFTITGSVSKARSITVADLAAMRQVLVGDVPLKNKKGENKGVLHGLKGVLLRDILQTAEIVAAKHKNYSELCIVLSSSDGFTNVYSWNELFNTDVGDKVYVITEQNGVKIDAMPERILVMSLSDKNSGSRHLKGLQKIEVKKPG